MKRSLAVLFLLVSAPVFSQDKDKVDQTKIDAAIDKGARYLLGVLQRGLPGMTHNYTTEMKYDELVLYTLIHAGTDPGDPQFQKLLDKAEDEPLKRTYRVVMTAMVLEAIDREKYQNRIADCAQFLADNQAPNGQWGYGEEIRLPERTPTKKDVATGTGKVSGGSKGSGTKALPRIKIKAHGQGKLGDNSNSQYAALGIRACVNAGIEFDPKIIASAIQWWEKSQQGGGGWAYCHEGVLGSAPYASMTFGGMGALCIYRWILKQDFKKDKAVLAAGDWVIKNWTLEENARYDRPKKWMYYNLYALERTGILFGTEKFGAHEWYPEGVELLLKEQKGEGSWVGPDDNPYSDTCFAILFLRRATQPLPKVATGR